MGKIFFICLPAYGHVNGTLPTLKILVERGNEVICYCREDFRRHFEEAGCTFREIPYPFNNFNSKPHGNNVNKSILKTILNYAWQTLPKIIARFMGKNPKHLMHTVVSTADPGVDMLNSVREWLPDFLKDIERENPDCLIEDYMSPFGRFVKAATDLPIIVTWPTFCHRWMLWYPRWLLALLLRLKAQKSWARYKELSVYLSELYHVPVLELDDLFDRNNGNLNLIFFPEQLDPFKQNYEDNCKHVGISVINDSFGSEHFSFDKLNNKKVIYISIGTVFNDNLKFYKKCLQSLGEKEYVVVMSIGDKIATKALGNIPDNFIVQSYVPRPAILERASLFITHGTSNAIAESLYYRVPMLLYPQAYDQFISTEAAANSGIGVLLRRNFSIVEMSQSVEYIMTNLSYYLDRIDKIRTTILDGECRAADFVQKFIPDKKHEK